MFFSFFDYKFLFFVICFVVIVVCDFGFIFGDRCIKLFLVGEIFERKYLFYELCII